MLTRADIKVLKRARQTVQAIESKLEFAGGRDYPMGRLAEACRACDDAILQVLVIAHVHELGVSQEDLRALTVQNRDA